MTARDARGRFAKAPARPRAWTVLATDRRSRAVHAVNRRRDRMTSRVPATAVGFATEAEARAYAARLPADPRWTFTVTRA